MRRHSVRREPWCGRSGATIHVGRVVSLEVFDLKGQKLYDLKGVNIYKLTPMKNGTVSGPSAQACCSRYHCASALRCPKNCMSL